MKFHLKRHHHNVINTEIKDTGGVENVAPNILNNRRSHNLAFEEENEDDNFNLTSMSEEHYNKNIICDSSKATRTEQVTIVDSFLKQNSFKDGGSQFNKITNLILFMLAKDILPYRTVEKEGFLLLMKNIAPLYKVPCRKTITELMADKYSVLSNLVQSELDNIENLSITTDIWTDPLNVKSYLGITVHYLVKDSLKSITIGVVDLSERHTAEYIQLCLETELDKWKICKSQILAIVSDNGANIKKAIKDGFSEEIHMPCCAHNLHLVVNKVLQSEHVSCICRKIKSIVTFFKKSVMAADYLREISNLKLIMAVETRWNSTYYMLERFIELSEKVSLVLLKCPTAPSMLSATELLIAKEFIQLLRSFEQSTKIVCGENYVSASKIIPIINILKVTLKEVVVETEIARIMQTLLLDELQERFYYIKNSLILSISTILDPRFKQVHFDDENAYSQAINEIVREINDTSTSSNNTDNYESVAMKENDFWFYHENLVILKKRRRSLNNIRNNEMPSELKYYLDEPPINIDDCPIQFWYLKSPTSLCKLALKYLSIVGTSVPSERLFSKAGRILTESRNRLNSIHLQHLLFLGSLSKEDWNIE
ncbi:E3 SUMO-protein ligase ZBED1-like isoform X2 [Prorops nasuta]